VPRLAERGGRISANAENIGRHRVIDTLRRAGGNRVGLYDLENVRGTPIYIHAKVCVIDDVWLEVGSDNLNRRSWTHDSELSCAVLDTTYDKREPIDPAGIGDRARVLARDTRLTRACACGASTWAATMATTPISWTRPRGSMLGAPRQKRSVRGTRTVVAALAHPGTLGCTSPNEFPRTSGGGPTPSTGSSSTRTGAHDTLVAPVTSDVACAPTTKRAR
jgi:hypothetical protein